MLITHQPKVDIKLTVEEAIELVHKLTQGIAKAAVPGDTNYGWFTMPANHKRTTDEQEYAKFQTVTIRVV